MSILRKIATAFRGHATEAGEAIVDANAITILEQEMRDADAELRKSDSALAGIMAKRKLQEDKVDSLADEIAKYETHARSAAETGNNDLALECAQRVTELRDQQGNEQTLLNNFTASEATLKKNIAQAKSNKKRMQQQIDMVKATDSVQKAQAAVSSRYSGANSSMKTAAESLERIKSKQALQAAELDSAEELANAENGGDLEAKLKAAGVTGGVSSAEDELSRILGK